MNLSVPPVKYMESNHCFKPTTRIGHSLECAAIVDATANPIRQLGLILDRRKAIATVEHLPLMACDGYTISV